MTIASEDKLFECHVNMDRVHSATLSQACMYVYITIFIKIEREREGEREKP